MRWGIDSTINDYVEAIEYVMNIANEDHTGVGTAFPQTTTTLSRIHHARQGLWPLPHTEFGEIMGPEDIRGIEDYPTLTAVMEQRGWNESRIEKMARPGSSCYIDLGR